MIYLYTGLPGSGKTLHVVETIDNFLKAGRTVFQNGITGYSDDRVQEIEDPHKWQELPDGCVIVIDECQRHYPTRKMTDPIPPIKDLSVHRHRGFDFVFITQHPSLLDVYVRRLVGEHTHHLRKFNSHTFEQITWGECVDDPQSSSNRRKGTSKIGRFNKAYFDKYKSAFAHTHKIRLPFRLIMLPLIVIACLGLFMWLIPYLQSMGKGGNQEVQSVENAQGFKMQQQKQASTKTLETTVAPLPARMFARSDYATLHQPRVKGVMSTMPIFDNRKPKSEPRLLCVATKSKCVCITEQGTRAGVEDKICRVAATEGIYDPYLEPPSDRPSVGRPVDRTAKNTRDGDARDVQASTISSTIESQPSTYLDVDSTP